MNKDNSFSQTIECVGARSASELLPAVYEDLRRLAAARMVREGGEHTLQATALVHEAWLRLASGEKRPWQSRAHFFGAASLAMRRILVERARSKSRLKRGQNSLRVDLHELSPEEASPDDMLILVDEALKELEAANPERARVVLGKFFGGLTNLEVAETLGISERSVNRHWLCAKAWLGIRLQVDL